MVEFVVLDAYHRLKNANSKLTQRKWSGLYPDQGITEEENVAKRVTGMDKMSVTELAALRNEIESALNDKIAVEREELQARIASLESMQARPSDRGATSTGIGKGTRRPRKAGGRHPLKGKKAAAKYRGPNGETWAGRGLTPKWLTALEKRGKKRETFLIGAKTAQ